MSEPYASDGFTRVTPYLTVNGAQKLLDFLVAVFDARVADRSERPDGKLAHAAVQIGDSRIELSDATEQWGPTPGAIHIYVPNVDETHRRALENGAKTLHEPMEMDYAERGSAVRDPFGNNWYIATIVENERTTCWRMYVASTSLTRRGEQGSRTGTCGWITSFPRRTGARVAAVAIRGSQDFSTACSYQPRTPLVCSGLSSFCKV